MTEPNLVEKTSTLLPPSQEGTISQIPSASLERIAQECKTSTSSLARLTVKPSACSLYEAILSYAAESEDVPMLVRLLKEDMDDDVPGTTEAMKAMKRLKQSMGLMPGSGLKEKKAPIPQIELGTSECRISWPPVQQKRKKKRKIGEGGSVDGEERFNVYVVHYTVGTPQATSFSLKTYEELTLVGLEKNELIRFTREILQWYYEEQKQNLDGKQFALHRFKTNNRGTGSWASEGLKRSRPVESVILPTGQIDTILGDVESFISQEGKSWYMQHGLPHRRSYLFYGPPGTGKTSTIRVIASRFGLNCCYLSVVNKDFSNQLLGDALSEIPANALIVLEDVDALFTGRKSETANSLTFSGVLNALDGLISADGILVVMTTNHIDKLDQALIRGGRVDRRFFFPMPDDDQIFHVFKGFYPECDDAVAREFVAKVRGREEKEAGAISTLQQLFIDMRGRGEKECVEGVDRFFDAHFPKSSETA